MCIDSAGNVGIGTTTTLGATRLNVLADAITTTPLGLLNTNNNVDTDPTVAQTVARFSRAGKVGITFSSAAEFGISRYEVSATNARTQMDIRLSHGGVGAPEVTVMSLRSNGNVGIGTSSPNDLIHGAGNAAYLRLSRTTSGSESNIIAGPENGSNAIYSRGATTESMPLRFVIGITERMRIDSAGNVGIGTSSPATRLHVDGTIRYTNRPAAGTITAIGFDTNGDLKASSSSLRYKHDIEDYDKGLAEVMQLRPVSFKFNGEENTNIGFIAEEVDALGLTEVMLYNEEEQPEGVIYANMVSLLTKAIQEQQAIINDLKARLDAANL
jgi:hypothetical protein